MALLWLLSQWGTIAPDSGSLESIASAKATVCSCRYMGKQRGKRQGQLSGV